MFPDRIAPLRHRRTATHMVYATGYDAAGFALEFADPLAERAEAWRDSYLAFLLPMLAILPLGYMLVRWITAQALRPLDRMRAEVERRDSQMLSPMDAEAHPAELSAVIATLNGFMARLAQALEGERAFASNAAHELRTPVAIALAQVQRMQHETADDVQRDRLAAVGRALDRMSRLVTRLLQLARAESGIGRGAAPVDVARLLPHVLRDAHGDGSRLRVVLPEGPVPSQMDADALAIVVGNLIDNALQHAPEGTPVDIVLDDAGVLVVRNGGTPVAAADLARIADRFASRRSGGFGLARISPGRSRSRRAGGWSCTLGAGPRGRVRGAVASALTSKPGVRIACHTAPIAPLMMEVSRAHPSCCPCDGRRRAARPCRRPLRRSPGKMASRGRVEGRTDRQGLADRQCQDRGRLLRGLWQGRHGQAGRDLLRSRHVRGGRVG
ncbi:hypothetical protein DPM13_04125 [Paracoccus mutanolyticus]|uniref:histidine kinase n=1 Tax=Paracoccus mutanolyticus TaxID=1499308 RepID=A0ABM6WQ00_9RHOB|nr:hypothetical protein DPM13_04125 [Paracoccus mutanolyticus]